VAGRLPHRDEGLRFRQVVRLGARGQGRKGGLLATSAIYLIKLIGHEMPTSRPDRLLRTAQTILKNCQVKMLCFAGVVMLLSGYLLDTEQSASSLVVLRLLPAFLQTWWTFPDPDSLASLSARFPWMKFLAKDAKHGFVA